MPMTTNDKLGLAQLALSTIGGVTSGVQGSRDRKAQEKADALSESRYNLARDDDFFQQVLAALQNQSNVEQSIMDRNFAGAQAFSTANPLGAEQNFRANNALFRGGLEALGGRQLANGTANIAAGFMDRPGIREALSDNAINEAINQRRIATAGLNPGAATEISGSNYAKNLFGDLQSSQNMQRDNAQNMMKLIEEQRAKQATAPEMPAESKDEPGFWKKLGGAVLPVAGLAANFIPGVGPVLGTAISAGAGALGGALTGGKAGALTGGLATGAASYGLNKAGLGNSDKGYQLNNNSTGPMSQLMQNVKTDVLLPGQGPTHVSPYASPVQQNKPLIQQVVAPPQTSLGQSFQLPPQQQQSFSTQPSFNSNFNMMGLKNVDLAGLTRNMPQSMTQQAQPQPTMAAFRPNAPDSGRFADAKVGGYGAPMNMQASKNYGDVAGPGMNTAPLGAALAGGALLGGYGSAAAAVSPQGQRLLGQGANYAQRLLGSGSGQANLTRQVPNFTMSAQRINPTMGPFQQAGTNIRGLLPQVSQTGMENQTVVRKMLDTLKAYNSGSPEDIKASQDIIKLIQPYLQGMK